MNSKLGLAAAAAILVIAAGLGAAVLTQRPAVDVGPSPTPSPSAVPSPSASARAVVGISALQATWDSATERPGHDPSLPATLPYTIVIDAGSIRIQDYKYDVYSTFSIAGPDSLSVVLENSAPDWDCHAGDEGSYRMGLSSGGGTLTLTPVNDACATRATILTGDWTHSDRGDLAPGHHVSALFRPFGSGTSGHFAYTVPSGWVLQAECANCFYLSGPGPAVPPAITLRSTVVPYTQDRDCNDSAGGVGRTPAEIAAWLTTLPGLTTTTPIPITVGGLSGFSIDLSVAPGWIGRCSSSQTGTSPPVFSSDVLTLRDEGSTEGSAQISGRARDRYLLLDRGDGQTLLIDVQAADAATWDAVIAAAIPVVDSFQFEH